jgi:hypothetical protein
MENWRMRFGHEVLDGDGGDLASCARTRAYALVHLSIFSF